MLAVTVDAIRAAVAAGTPLLRTHSLRRMGEHRISVDDLVQALSNCELVEDYPNDPRGPSALVLGLTTSGRPLHAVCTFDFRSGRLFIITVYEPETPRWLDEHTRNPAWR